jgi:recombination protein RecT
VNTNNHVVTKNNTERSIKDLILKRKTWIEQALPKFFDADRFTRICFTELRKNPTLMRCKPESLVGAMIQSAQLGLFPNSATGDAYLIPYKDECTLIIGYQGMIRLAYNSAKVTKIIARPVYKDDIFEYSYGTDEYIKHIPQKWDNESGEMIYCYACAKLKTGETMFVVLSKQEIDEKHMKFSSSVRNDKTKRYSPWVTNYVEMAKKTAIRVLAKYLPRSTEDLNMYKAIELDEQADRGEQDNSLIIDGVFSEESTETKADQLANEMKSANDREEIVL